MVSVFAALARVPVHYWAWIHFKLAIVAWLLIYSANTPPPTVVALGAVLPLWPPTAIIGAFTSIVGMVISVQPAPRARKHGPTVELTGLALMAAGPLLHMVTLVIIIVTATGDDALLRSGPAAQSYALLAAAIARAVEVIPRYRAARDIQTAGVK